MRILSSFDTRLKQRHIMEYTEKYSQKYVFIIHRSKLYYYYKVILRILFGMVSQGVVSAILYHMLWDNHITLVFWVGLFFGMVFYFIAGENYIDYTMNYAIFTPEEAILVEQIGIFNRNIKSLDIKKIKWINIRTSNIFFSIFNDGLITITSDTSDHHFGEIVFKYVHNPEKTKDKIQHIISYAHTIMDQSIHNL